MPKLNGQISRCSSWKRRGTTRITLFPDYLQSQTLLKYNECWNFICAFFVIYLSRRLFSCKRFINKSEVHFISLEIKLRLRWFSARLAERGKRAPPARRRACSENARGVTIVSFRIVTKFDDRNHPPSTRAGSSRSDSRQGVGAVQCVPSARLCNSKTYLCINLKIASIVSVSMLPVKSVT